MNKIYDTMKEILKQRNEKFGLNNTDTSKILDNLLTIYVEMIFNAPQNVTSYTIHLIIKNANGLNKLGNIEDLYENWGDNYFLDYNNCLFLPYIVDTDGNLEIGNEIYFKNINKLIGIKDIAFSLSELIDICKSENIQIIIYSENSTSENFIIIEIDPTKKYIEHNSLNTYLNSIQK